MDRVAPLRDWTSILPLTVDNSAVDDSTLEARTLPEVVFALKSEDFTEPTWISPETVESASFENGWSSTATRAETELTETLPV